MADFDTSKDRVFATVEVILAPDGSALCKPAATVEQPDKASGAVRYRLSVASYNGGEPKLRRQTVYQTAKGEERVNAAKSLPLAHVAPLAKLATAFVAKVQTALARKAG